VSDVISQLCSRLSADELRLFSRRNHLSSEHIWLAAARCAGTCAPQVFEFEIRLGPVIPRNGELVSDLFNIRWSQTHASHNQKFVPLSVQIRQADFYEGESAEGLCIARARWRGFESLSRDGAHEYRTTSLHPGGSSVSLPRLSTGRPTSSNRPWPLPQKRPSYNR